MDKGEGVGVLNHPTIKALAEKYNHSPAQICLRWATQRGYEMDGAREGGREGGRENDGEVLICVFLSFLCQGGGKRRKGGREGGREGGRKMMGSYFID